MCHSDLPSCLVLLLEADAADAEEDYTAGLGGQAHWVVWNAQLHEGGPHCDNSDAGECAAEEGGEREG